jgi:hypothetical protein
MRLLALCGMSGTFMRADGEQVLRLAVGDVFLSDAENAARLIRRGAACAAPPEVEEPKRKSAKKGG